MGGLVGQPLKDVHLRKLQEHSNQLCIVGLEFYDPETHEVCLYTPYIDGDEAFIKLTREAL